MIYFPVNFPIETTNIKKYNKYTNYYNILFYLSNEHLAALQVKYI